MTSPPAVGANGLLEVAVSVPPGGVYTYAVPARGAPIPIGAQVVVPFGGRHVTGFVVGQAAVAPPGLRAVAEVIDDEPSLDPDVLELGRWTASYYLGGLGEVLRMALPQGERTTAQRRVCLTEQGLALLARAPGAPESAARAFLRLSLDDGDRALLERLRGKGRAPRALTDDQRARLPRLEELNLVVIGDDVSGKVVGRDERFIVATDEAAPAPPARASARVALLAKLRAAGAPGLLLASLTASERAALRPLEQAGLVRRETRPRSSDGGATEAAGPPLNPHQAQALAALGAALATRTFSPFVLQGITGSGKTEVYLRLIAEARATGRGCLVLVPEIALTPQLAARFRARFGDDVAVLHSGLQPAERRMAWRRLRAGAVSIALGARSAIFAPVRDLGVLVVDEEHDASFKQDKGVPYNARDLALVRAQRAGAVVVLGSATPSLESFQNAATGRYQRLLLPVRANPAAATRALPPVDVVDLRRESPMADGLFSKRLLDAVKATLAAGEQSILFLNRRGFAPVVLCRGCGFVLRCPDCAVSFTFHRQGDRLICHYCARIRGFPRVCPSCSEAKLEPLGVGTERVESILRSYLPNARIARLDRDVAGGSSRGSTIERVLASVAAGRIDVLVGTQMVTKGHDFPGVTLVGVLLPDQGMHLPDFRAAERTFQLLEQVAGRAGRAEREGRVIVQTFTPEHPAIECLRTHDYEGFVQAELRRRREAGYPPAVRALALRLEGRQAAAVRASAEEVARVVLPLAKDGPGGARVLGPAEAPIPLIRGVHRWQIWVFAADAKLIAAAAQRALTAKLVGGVRLRVDVDPQSVL